MTTEPIGRRIAMYRRAAGFKAAEDLAEAINNPAITKATIQNVESGRKADLSVAQLLDIAKALGVPPVALVVPIDRPADTVTIPGVSEAFSSMTNWDLVRWFNDKEQVSSPPLRVWMRAVMSNIDTLTTAIEEFPRVLALSETKAEVVEHKFEDDSGEYSLFFDPQIEAQETLHHVAATARLAYDRLKTMTRGMDLTWAEGPWLTFGLGRPPHVDTDSDG